MSATAEFFDQQARRGHEPLLRRVSARVRFDAPDGDKPVHRLVTIDHGDLRVSEPDDAPPDATFTCSQSELDALVSGRSSAMASLLRGALTVQGDPELVVLAQRLFSHGPATTPGPDGTEPGGGRHE